MQGAWLKVDSGPRAANKLLQVAADLLCALAEKCTQRVNCRVGRIDLWHPEVECGRPLLESNCTCLELIHAFKKLLQWFVAFRDIEIFSEQHAVSKLVDHWRQLVDLLAYVFTWWRRCSQHVEF